MKRKSKFCTCPVPDKLAEILTQTPCPASFASTTKYLINEDTLEVFDTDYNKVGTAKLVDGAYKIEFTEQELVKYYKAFNK